MNRNRSLLQFFLLSFTFTWLCWLPISAARAGWIHLPLSEARLANFGQYGPLLAALIVTFGERGRDGLKQLGRAALQWRVSPGWLLVALLLPPATYLVALQLHAWCSGKPVPAPPRLSTEALLLTLPFVLVTGGPLGEEIGWRGFALPRFQQRWSPPMASLILGVLWAVWHLPLWWIAQVPTTFDWYLASMIPLTYVMTCVQNRAGGSSLSALLFHASLNSAFLYLPISLAYREWTFLMWALAAGLFVLKQDRCPVALTGAKPEPALATG